MARNRKAQAQSAPDLEEKLRQRAYELYEARGREAGHDVDDWLQAEAELSAAKSSTEAA